MTHEYERAALDYHLTYEDLKQLARTGMEHDFLPGESFWAEPDKFGAPGSLPGSGCRAATSPRNPARRF